MTKKLDVKALGTAAVYGAVDIFAEDYDAKHPVTYVAGLNATDLTRLAAFAIGVGAPYVTKSAKLTQYTDVLQTASLPLLEKTIYKIFKGATAARSGYQSNRMVMRSPAGTPVLTPLLQDNVF